MAATEVVEEAAVEAAAVDLVGLVEVVVEKEKVTVEEEAAAAAVEAAEAVVEAVEVADEEEAAGRCSGVSSEPNDCCFTISWAKVRTSRKSGRPPSSEGWVRGTYPPLARRMYSTPLPLAPPNTVPKAARSSPYAMLTVLTAAQPPLPSSSVPVASSVAGSEAREVVSPKGLKRTMTPGSKRQR